MCPTKNHLVTIRQKKNKKITLFPASKEKKIG
jgi:hypothetical protein